MAVIAIEEHFTSPQLRKLIAPREGAIQAMLDNASTRLIKEMDEGGIDIAVLSENNPAAHNLDPETSVAMAKASNDFLHAQIQANPTRFKGFAALPLPDPKAAADELERAVTRLKFKGAMVHGLTALDGANLFLDDKRFWPIFERAQALDVPLYIHPAVPHKAVIEAYYKDYIEQFPSLMTAAWGFGVEAATQGIRLVLSGVFEAYPRLKIILGHLGEGLPFYLWRINMALGRQGNRATPFRDTFREHFWITTSGAFSTPSLLCCVMEMGVDRILFSVDYPFVPNPPGVKWMENVPLSNEDRAKILNGNATRLLKL